MQGRIGIRFEHATGGTLFAAINPQGGSGYVADHVEFGHSLAADINNGVAPAAEAQWVYDHTPADITGADAKNLVSCAITVWL